MPENRHNAESIKGGPQLTTMWQQLNQDLQKYSLTKELLSRLAQP